MKCDGKDFEAICLWRSTEIAEKSGQYVMGRCGTMSVFIDGEFKPIPSLPDFEGALMGGRMFCFDAKVCSQASFALTGGTAKSFLHQYKFLQRRAKFGVLTFVLIHWNERVLKGKTDPEFTSLLRICDNALWQSYDRGELKQIGRTLCKLHGIEVVWDAPEGRHKLSPNLYNALLELQKQVDQERTA